MSHRVVAATIVLIAACSFNPGDGQGGDDAGDPDGGDDDGGPIDGAGSDGVCAARCEGDSLITCNGAQDNPPMSCPAGCLTTGAPHCATLVPSNGASMSDLTGVIGDLVVAAGQVVVIDGDDGSIIGYVAGTPTTIRDPGVGLGDSIRFRALAQGNGAPEVAIFGVRSLAIADGGRLWIAGDRPVLILVEQTASIAGALDAGGGHSGATGMVDCQECAGAGGGAGSTDLTAASGCGPGLDGNYYPAMDETGGGGGGLGSVGGRGGDSNGGAAVGGDVTPITGCPGDDLIPLEGGSGGGQGALTGAVGGAEGGGGGGAVQITALLSISLLATADLYAGGAGGVGTMADYGGGGGGAGGGVLLEAPEVMVASGARITANGGGGGSGREANRGENGARSGVRASGGAGNGTGNNDGRGGLGGVGALTGQVATQGNGTIDGTGGGGGAGVVRINTVDPFLLPNVVISPPPTTGAAMRQ